MVKGAEKKIHSPLTKHSPSLGGFVHAKTIPRNDDFAWDADTLVASYPIRIMGNGNAVVGEGICIESVV